MTDSTAAGRLWGGRFTGGPADAMAALSRSTQFDWRLARHDLAGSRAHASALRRAGLLTDAEHAAMLAALDGLAADVASGALVPTEADEDVHGCLERALRERVGPELGGRLRAGRSRNDQIATLIRAYLRVELVSLSDQLVEVVEALSGQAGRHLGVVMPGRTHLQHAQPILLSHHLLAHAWPLVRDLQRIRDLDARLALSPYGSGALAGTSLGLDPRGVARDLGFADSVPNSIDGTAARDLVAETAFVLAQIAVDLSRLSEDVILWCTHEFGFATLDDAWSTGSSIMPQKKNPDLAELIRGKAGRVYGALVALLTAVKGLPLSYNKDLQEDKEAVFDALDTANLCLDVLPPMLETAKFFPGRMREAAAAGFLNATDLADYLVGKGVPFRDAYQVSGALVRLCVEKGATLETLPLSEYQKLHPAFDEGVYAFIDLGNCVNRRNVYGGPAPEAVRVQIENARAKLSD